jgi:hypothetical protein
MRLTIVDISYFPWNTEVMDISNKTNQPHTPPTPIKDQSSKGIKWAIGGIILAIIVLIVLIIFLPNIKSMLIQQPQENTPVIPTPTLFPTPTLVTEETTTWKTYTSNEYNFSLKHPSVLAISTQLNGQQITIGDHLLLFIRDLKFASMYSNTFEEIIINNYTARHYKSAGYPILYDMITIQHNDKMFEFQVYSRPIGSIKTDQESQDNETVSKNALEIANKIIENFTIIDGPQVIKALPSITASPQPTSQLIPTTAQ